MHAERRRALLMAAVTMLATLLVSAGSARSAPDTPGISPATQFTPVASQVLTRPQPVKASDGNYHMAYELLLNNVTPVTIHVETVEIRDAADGRVILSLTGPDLQAEMSPIGKLGPDNPGDRSIASSSTSIIWLDVVAATKDGIPKKIDHRVTGKSLHLQALTRSSPSYRRLRST